MRLLSVASVAVPLALFGAWAEPASGSQWRWPLAGEVLTGFSYGGDPFAAGQHRGIDVAAAPGTAVLAAADATVTHAGLVGSSGLTLTARTADGRYDVSYLHLGSVAVGPGDAIERGQPIATSGTSGRGSVAAPHLHLGVRRAGTEHAYRDPLRLLPPRGAPRDGRPRPIPVRGPAPLPVGARPGPPTRARAWLGPAALPAGQTGASARAPWAARPAVGETGRGWAIACAALLAAAALAACGWWRAARTAAGRPSASSIGVRAVLRHHADLLRQR